MNVRSLSRLVILFVAAGSSAARTPPTPPVASTAPSPGAVTPGGDLDLPARQLAVRQRLERLESRIVQLARLLNESEPEKAERLRDALRRVGQEQVDRRLERLIELLQSMQLGDAAGIQKDLLIDLVAILTDLTDTLSDVEHKRKERERIEAFKRSVEAVLRKQLDTIHQTRQAAALRKLADEWRAAADQLTELADRQAELRERAADSAAERARQQQELENATRAQAADLQARSDGAPEVARAGMAESIEDVAEAARAMDAAQDRLRGSNPSAAGEKQQDAEQRLRRAAQRLREQAKVADARDVIRQVERLQREAEQQAAELARQMLPKKGDQPGAPGRPSVERARQHMQNAADQLGEDRPVTAEESELDALEQLQKARDELNDALRQVRQDEVEEMLTALELRFKRLLTEEEQLRADVILLSEKKKTAWTRDDDQMLAKLAASQQALADECRGVQRVLSDDGTTVVLPQLVERMTQEMAEVARRLAVGQTGADVVPRLDDILAALREILDAIEAQKEDMEQQRGREGGAQGGSRDGPRPLIPGSAELKLLRTQQQRINTRTVELARRAEGGSASSAAQADLDELARWQAQLVQLVRRMNERQ